MPPTPAIRRRRSPNLLQCLPKNSSFQGVRCTVSSSAIGCRVFAKFRVSCSCEFGAGSNVDAAFMSIQLIHQRVDPVSFSSLQIDHFAKRGCQFFAILKWLASNRRLQAIWRDVPWECFQYFCALTSVRLWRPWHFLWRSRRWESKRACLQLLAWYLTWKHTVPSSYNSQTVKLRAGD